MNESNAPIPTDSTISPAGPHNIHQFRRQHVGILIVLTIITIGFYYLLWLLRQVKIINRLLPDNAISAAMINATIVFLVASYLTTIADLVMNEENPTTQIIDKLVGYAADILILILLFKVRNRLNII